MSPRERETETSSPPSEGPPTPEEQARWKAADDLVWQWEKLRGSVIGGSRYSATRGKLVDLVAEAISAAKRSAHLEDARAGCEFCASDAYTPAEIRSSDGNWKHYGKITRDVRWCERPEVWDALSLPPGGPSGTIKSTASEQPDGKTR